MHLGLSDEAREQVLNAARVRRVLPPKVNTRVRLGSGPQAGMEAGPRSSLGGSQGRNLDVRPGLAQMHPTHTRHIMTARDIAARVTGMLPDIRELLA